MPVNGRSLSPVGVKMFTALWLLLCPVLLVAEPAPNQRMLTTDQAIKLAEQQYGGRVIKLLNAAQTSRSGFYRMRLINRSGQVLTLYIDRRSGTVTELEPSVSSQPPVKRAKPVTESVTRP